MGTFILILVLATSSSSQAGSTSVTAEFSSKEKCMAAGKAMADAAYKTGNYVMAYGCFAK